MEVFFLEYIDRLNKAIIPVKSSNAHAPMIYLKAIKMIPAGKHERQGTPDDSSMGYHKNPFMGSFYIDCFLF
jgi:hypothetical protein